jgi:hypothetical protein
VFLRVRGLVHVGYSRGIKERFSVKSQQALLFAVFDTQVVSWWVRRTTVAAVKAKAAQDPLVDAMLTEALEVR